MNPGPDAADEGMMVDLELRDQLLLAALPNVTFDGWSLRALKDGARAVDCAPEAAHRMFPGGVPELVEAFDDWADRQMLASLVALDLPALKVRERIALAVRARLSALAPYREAVRRELSYLALPQHVPLGLRLLYRTVDVIWQAAGDTATDFNFYTKRGLLAGVQSATLLYWLNDESLEMADTAAFLDRRIGEVMRVGRWTASLGSLGSLPARLAFLPSPVRFARHLRHRAEEALRSPDPSGRGARL